MPTYIPTVQLSFLEIKLIGHVKELFAPETLVVTDFNQLLKSFRESEYCTRNLACTAGIRARDAQSIKTSSYHSHAFQKNSNPI